METNEQTPTNKTAKGASLSALVSLFSSTGQSRTQWVLLFISIILVLGLPLGNIIFIYPAFTSVLVKSIEKDAEQMGSYLVPPELKFSEIRADRMTQRLYGDIYKLEHDLGVIKIRIFSSQGEIVYSTDSKEIGTHATNDYFYDRISKGERISKLVEKGGISLEGDPVKYDIVETYLPLMNGKRFLGAFELYYDVTETKSQLDTLLLYSTLIMTLLAGSLVIAVLFLMRKEGARQLAKKRAEALKGDIDRITKHDLKGPFIGVLSGLEYLEKFTELDDEQTSITSQMRDSADKGLDMINHSLGMYKMEVGTYEYTPSEMDILGVTRRVVSNLSSLALTYGVELIVSRGGNEMADATPMLFRAEEALCYSLLTNLIKNGIEASKEGERVMITLTENKGIKLTVHNPAPVPKDIRNTFFEKYATSGKSSGTGLGTYSAQLMVSTMGGTIDLSTSTDSGTLITVMLPWPPETT